MAINPHGRVVAFEEVVINLRDTSGTCSSAGGQDGLEIGHAGLFALSGGSFSLRIQIALRRRYFADYPVDVGGGCALHIVGDVGIDVQHGRRRHMPQHGGEGLHVHTVLQGHRCEGMPLRYNYDKPEKPRISRVFGYLARFFILFQTEKSSREVVIS